MKVKTKEIVEVQANYYENKLKVNVETTEQEEEINMKKQGRLSR